MGLMGQQTLSILIPAQRAGISKGLDKRALGDPSVSVFPLAEVLARLHHVTVLYACWLLKGHAGRSHSDREFVLATRRGTPRGGVLGPTTRKRSSSMTTPSPDSTQSADTPAAAPARRAGVRDATPTWSAVLPVLIAALQDGDETGKDLARGQLRRMAAVADLGNDALLTLSQLAEADEQGLAYQILQRAQRMNEPTANANPGEPR